MCQLCDKPRHSAKTCRPRGQPSNYFQPQANLVKGESSHSNNNWVLNLGATHHITFDLHNLSMHSDYVGNEDVVGSPSLMLVILLLFLLLPHLHWIMICVHL